MRGITPSLAILGLISTLASSASAAAIRTASTTDKALGFDPDFTGTPPVIKQLPEFTGTPSVVKYVHKKPLFEGTPPVLSQPETAAAANQAAAPTPTAEFSDRLARRDPAVDADQSTLWQEPPPVPTDWMNRPPPSSTKQPPRTDSKRFPLPTRNPGPPDLSPAPLPWPTGRHDIGPVPWPGTWPWPRPRP